MADQHAESVAVRMWLTEAENAQVTDEDIASAASVFIGRPNPRMVANRIAVQLGQIGRSHGEGCVLPWAAHDWSYEAALIDGQDAYSERAAAYFDGLRDAKEGSE